MSASSNKKEEGLSRAGQSLLISGGGLVTMDAHFASEEHDGPRKTAPDPRPESRHPADPRRPGPADRLPRRARYGPRPQGGLREPQEDRLLRERRAVHRRRSRDPGDGAGGSPNDGRRQPSR